MSILIREFNVKAPGARWAGRPCIVANRPRDASRTVTGAAQGRYIRADAFTWLPVSSPTSWSEWPSSAPLVDPVRFFQSPNLKVRFEGGSGVSCWSPSAKSGCHC